MTFPGTSNGQVQATGSDPAGPSDWGQLAGLRQGTYRFLAGCLLFPDADRLETAIAAARLLEELGVEEFAFVESWRSVDRELATSTDPAAVEADYLRLFVTGPDGPLCPPTESAHVNGQGCGADESLADLRAQYLDLGLAPSVPGPYPADHVATQLEAMAALCHQEAHAWEQDQGRAAGPILRREWRFLDRHLAAWLPRFARRLERSQVGGLYPAVGAAAHAFVIHDLELVANLTRAQLK